MASKPARVGQDRPGAIQRSDGQGQGTESASSTPSGKENAALPLLAVHSNLVSNLMLTVKEGIGGLYFAELPRPCQHTAAEGCSEAL